MGISFSEPVFEQLFTLFLSSGKELYKNRGKISRMSLANNEGKGRLCSVVRTYPKSKQRYGKILIRLHGHVCRSGFFFFFFFFGVPVGMGKFSN